MAFLRSYFILILAFYSLGSLAQENSQFYQLTKEACQSYIGDNPSNYLSETSHQYENPLNATALGHTILKSSFSAAYSDYNYSERTNILPTLLESPDFYRALDECYKDDKISKSYFVFFLHQLDLQGKTSALYSEATAFLGGAFLISKFSQFIIKRAAWMKNVFKWTGRTVVATIGAVITLLVGQTVYKIVRQYNDGLDYEIKDAVKEKTKKSNFYQLLALDSLQSLEEEITILKSEIKNTTVLAKKNELEKLLRESERLSVNLRQQVNEIQKKLTPSASF